jgi:Peptidase family M23
MTYRTALRWLLSFVLAAAVATGGATAGNGKGTPPQLFFPVIGQVTYTDDFGDLRGNGRHEGNDLLAPKRSLAVAVEPGTVKFWTTSARAGCMLYLYGASGTTYLYIHLNNDLTPANDNRGKCIAGVAYADGLKSGDRVKAGQPVGFVGDSGDADGLAAHLHFEVHPQDGAAVDPFPYLKKATQLLLAPPPAGAPFTLKLQGTVVGAAETQLDVEVDSLQVWPTHAKVSKLGKTLTLAVAAADLVSPARLGAALPGRKVSVWTMPALPTLAALTGAAYALSAQKIELR